MRKSFGQEEIKKIEEFHNEGKSNGEIAKLLNRHPNSVRKHLSKIPSFIPKKVRQYHCDFDYFETIDSPQKAYWLGFICGDGNISRDCLHIGIHEQDFEFLKGFVKDIGGNYPVTLKTYISKGKPSNICRVDIYSKKIKTDLSKYGVVPAKTGNMEWSKIQNNVPESLLVDFIRGFFDADGSWKTPNKKMNFFIGEKHGCLITGILNYFKEHVVSTSSNIQKRSDGFCSLCIGGNKKVKKIFEWLYKDAVIFMERKRSIAQSYIDNYQLQISNRPSSCKITQSSSTNEF